PHRRRTRRVSRPGGPDAYLRRHGPPTRSTGRPAGGAGAQPPGGTAVRRRDADGDAAADRRPSDGGGPRHGDRRGRATDRDVAPAGQQLTDVTARPGSAPPPPRQRRASTPRRR